MKSNEFICFDGEYVREDFESSKLLANKQKQLLLLEENDLFCCFDFLKIFCLLLNSSMQSFQSSKLYFTLTLALAPYNFRQDSVCEIVESILDRRVECHRVDYLK